MTIRSWYICISLLAFAGAAAAAQDITETTSTGERSEDVYREELGTGSTIWQAKTLAEVNGEQIAVGVPTVTTFTRPVERADVAAVIPTEPYIHTVGGVDVVITAWSGPEFVNSEDQIRDVFRFESFNFYTIDETTIQLTSGDGPNPFVPIGYRGFCADSGIGGATNFDDYVGAFASCDYSDDIVTVLPGTINRNTHTTTIYRNEYYVFESYDYTNVSSWVIRPAASQTWSAGTLSFTSEENIVERVDVSATWFRGMLGNTVLFDRTIDQTFSTQAAQDLLASLTTPTGISLGGEAAVLVWSAPVYNLSFTQLVGSVTQRAESTLTTSVVTVTRTFGTGSGETVSIGDRGTCSSTGSSGLVNGPSPTGAVAGCEGGIGYLLAIGERNTNTHTTSVTEQRIVNTTVETYRTTDLYLLQATAVAVGQIHAASRDLALSDARKTGQNARMALARSAGGGAGLWVQLETGSASRDADGGLPGFDSDRDGVVGGLTLALGGIARAGLTLGYFDSRLGTPGTAYRIESDSLQLALSAALEPGQWRIEAVAGTGWTNLANRRGSAALGGISTGEADDRSYFAMIEAGPELSLGPVEMRPFIGFDWLAVRQGAFAESGGVALGGMKARFEQTEARAGFDASGRIPIGPELAVALDGELASVVLLSGRDRLREVFFLANPGLPVLVTAAPAGESFAEGRLQAALLIGDSLRIWIGGEGRSGSGEEEWRANAGISLQL